LRVKGLRSSGFRVWAYGSKRKPSGRVRSMKESLSRKCVVCSVKCVVCSV